MNAPGITQTTAEIARLIGADLVGDPNLPLGRPAAFDVAAEGDFAFVDAGKSADVIRASRASVLVVAAATPGVEAAQIIAADPRRSFFEILRLTIAPEWVAPEPGVAASARIAPTARVSRSARIDDFVAIAADAVVGDHSHLYPGVVIGEGCRIGAEVTLHANVSIRAGTIIEDHVTIHDNSVIGADGFGYIPSPAGLIKVPQIGIVVIESEVEIGANTCIDRATLGETRIGRGTKIDNLVQIAHNVSIGPHSVVVSQVGISGSTRVGRGAMIGGQAGLVGHLEIGNFVKIGAQSGVGDDLPDRSEVLGSPAYDKRIALRTAMTLPRLPEMRRQLQDLARRLALIESQSDDGTNATP